MYRSGGDRPCHAGRRAHIRHPRPARPRGRTGARPRIHMRCCRGGHVPGTPVVPHASVPQSNTCNRRLPVSATYRFGPANAIARGRRKCRAPCPRPPTVGSGAKAPLVESNRSTRCPASPGTGTSRCSRPRPSIAIRRGRTSPPRLSPGAPGASGPAGSAPSRIPERGPTTRPTGDVGAGSPSTGGGRQPLPPYSSQDFDPFGLIVRRRLLLIRTNGSSDRHVSASPGCQPQARRGSRVHHRKPVRLAAGGAAGQARSGARPQRRPFAQHR